MRPRGGDEGGGGKDNVDNVDPLAVTDPPATPATTDPPVTDPSTVTLSADEYASMMEVVNEKKATDARTKAGLVANLTSLNGCKFTKEQLEGWDIPTLQTLSESLGGGKANTTNTPTPGLFPNVNNDSPKTAEPPRGLTAALEGNKDDGGGAKPN